MVARCRLGIVCIAAGLLVAAPVAAQEGADQLRDTIDKSAADTLGVPPANALPPQPDLEPEPPRRIPRRTIDQEDEKLGMGMGPVKLYGKMETGIVASTNPAKSTTNRKAGIGLRAAPTLRLQSDWSRHDLRAEASGEFIEYPGQSSASSQQATLQSSFRLDIRRTTFANFEAGYDLKRERDTTTLTTEPRLDQTFAAVAAVTHDFGNLQGSLGLRIKRFIADDVRLANGTTEDNGDRDYIAPEFSARLSLHPRAPLSPFIETAIDRRYFDDARNRFGNKSNSLGLSTSLGVAFNDSPIWEGSLAATWLWRDFVDSDLASESTLGLTGAMTWRPTDFALLTFTTGVSLDDTREANQTVTRKWTTGLAANYSLSDALSLNANASVEIADGAGPSDLTTEVGIGAEWQANTYVAFALRGENTWFAGGGAGDDYTDQRLIASLILQR